MDPGQFCPENGRTLVFLCRLYLVLRNCFFWIYNCIHKSIIVLCGSWQFKPYLRCQAMSLGICLEFATSFHLHCPFIRPGGLASCLALLFFFVPIFSGNYYRRKKHLLILTLDSLAFLRRKCCSFFPGLISITPWQWCELWILKYF